MVRYVSRKPSHLRPIELIYALSAFGADVPLASKTQARSLGFLVAAPLAVFGDV